LLENPGFRAWVLKEDETAAAYWNTFLSDHPEHREVIDRARVLLMNMQEHFESHELTADSVERKLQAQLEHLGAPQKLGKARRINIQGRNRYRLMAAASVVLLLIAGAVWWAQSTNLVYATNFGEWETAELPDGSVVKLNSNTTLRLDSHWEEGATRKVWLSGEAYFQVAKKPDTQSRFQVITDDLTVEVLGTVFNVHSRGEHTAVFLEEGKVRLALEADTLQEVVLEPGQKLAYSKIQHAILDNGPASAELMTSWKDGLLKFKKTPMREVLQKVEEIYGISFRLEDETQYDRLINSQGIPIEKLDETVRILAQVLAVDVQLENDIYILR
jgi:ferric-dicitrate binding protein FerR (iron transport regulator)